MDLHGHLANLEVGSDLLVESTGDHESHDFPLPCGQRLEPLLQFGDYRGAVAPGAIPLDSELDRIDELLIAERLGQELDGAGFHGTDRPGDSGVASEADTLASNV